MPSFSYSLQEPAATSHENVWIWNKKPDTLSAPDDPTLQLSVAEVFLRDGAADLALPQLAQARSFSVPEPATSLLEAEIHGALGDHAAAAATLS